VRMLGSAVMGGREIDRHCHGEAAGAKAVKLEGAARARAAAVGGEKEGGRRW